MKKILLISLLSLSTFRLFAFMDNFPPRYDDCEMAYVRYPLSFLLGKNGAEMDEKKAFEIFKELKNVDTAKYMLAYCYYAGLGVEKDRAKADEALNSIKKLSTFNGDQQHRLSVYIKFPVEFRLKHCDIIYDRTKDFARAYNVISRDKDLPKEDKERIENLRKELAL